MPGRKQGRLRLISLFFKAMHFADGPPALYFCTWSSHFVRLTNDFGISETSLGPSSQGKMANLSTDITLNQSCCYRTCAAEVTEADSFCLFSAADKQQKHDISKVTWLAFDTHPLCQHLLILRCSCQSKEHPLPCQGFALCSVSTCCSSCTRPFSSGSGSDVLTCHGICHGRCCPAALQDACSARGDKVIG